ncbi:hypothetical protein MPER_08465 [Moniliophthora perniciosa FA553]|nr:hypothetical protein MPER_08465 [Moniliophthora perniciosa FA553]
MRASKFRFHLRTPPQLRINTWTYLFTTAANMSSPEADILTSALEFAVEVAQGKLRAGIVLTPKTVRALTAILPQISQIVLDSMPKPEKKDVEIQTLPCITIPRLDPYANHESAAQREIDPLNLNSVLNDESIFVTPSALPPTSFPIGPPAYLASGPSTLLTASTSTAAGPPTFRSMAREHHWYDRQYDFGQIA